MRDFHAEAVAELDAEFPSVSFIEWSREHHEKAATRWAWIGLTLWVGLAVSQSAIVGVLALIAFVPFWVNAERAF